MQPKTKILEIVIKSQQFNKQMTQNAEVAKRTKVSQISSASRNKWFQTKQLIPEGQQTRNNCEQNYFFRSYTANLRILPDLVKTTIKSANEMEKSQNKFLKQKSEKLFEQIREKMIYTNFH